MKGIAHFASAIAVASFLPQVVERSAQGSFILLLAGLGGLMPDFLDFRLARFLPRPDVQVDAGLCGAGGAARAEMIARRLAAAAERAQRTAAPVCVSLGTIRLGIDLWQQYSVRFGRDQVRVRVGPRVDGAQTPVETESLERAVSVTVPVLQADDRAVVVDVFSGTLVQFNPRGERVEVVFLPWHRRWSHSLTLIAFLGGATVLLLGPLAGLVFTLGLVTHVLEDQLGHMGSNLLYPLTQSRTGGLQLFHSGDALPNLFTVWLSAILVLVNLDRFSTASVLDPWRLLLLALVIPWVLIWFLEWSKSRRYRRRRPGNLAKDRSTSGQVRSDQMTLVDVSQDGERTPAQGERIDV